MRKNNKIHSASNKFKYSIIASAIVGMFAATPMYAAEQEDEEVQEDEVEVIEIVGAKRDWFSAQNIKKEASSVVDAISSEDVGVLPDRSVLEAIVRVPGVTMSRIVDGNDSEHFGTEGTGVNVRGLTFVRSEFNGRDSFSASGGGGLNFSDVPPELLGSVEIFKSPTASQIEGGIGGSVNLKTKKPFDAGRRLIAFSADTTYADLREESSPSFSGLYSDIFESDDMGKFGWLISYSDNELRTQSDSVLAQRHFRQDYEGEEYWMARGMRMNRKTDDRNRQGGAAAFQWENPNESVRLTAEYIRSDASLAWIERAIEIDAQKAEPYLPVDGTSFEFDEHGVFESGTLTTNEGWRGQDAERQPSGGNFGQQLQMVTRERTTDSLVEDFSFNIMFIPTDALAISVDLQHVKGSAEVYDMSVWSAMRAVPSLNFAGDGMPGVELFSPEYNGEANHDSSSSNTFFTDPHNAFLQSAMDHISQNEAEENAGTLDISYQFDSGFISSLEFGVRHAEREQTNRQSRYNWGYLSEAWTGDGSIWLDDPAAQNIPTEIETFDNFGRGSQFRVDGNAGILFPSIDLVSNYDTARNLLPQVSVGDGAWVPLSGRTSLSGELENGLFVENEINSITQTNTAAYIQANFDTDISDIYISGNLGVRYVKMTTEADGFIKYPDSVANPNDPDDIYGKLPADQQAFGNNAFYAMTSKNDYDTFLPSFNMKIELNEDLITRVGLSKSIAAPNLGMLRNHISVSGADMEREVDESQEEPEVTAAWYTRYTADSGNPGLKPIESKNVDLTLEWYFAEVGSLTGALFYKDLEGYFVNGTRLEKFENNGVEQVVEVGGAINSGKGSIKGFEIAYQQFFDFLPSPFDGIGMQFNYTYIDESGAPNSGLKPDFPVGEGNGNFEVAYDSLPLEGVSKDNVNLVAMYEKEGWQARVAYNWRSEYLLTSSDVRSQSPTFNDDAGYLDASLFYKINDNFTIGIQGSNLTDTINKTSVLLADGTPAKKGSFVVDRRVSAILRAVF
uniref:TonB-dependent receptor n=1 Tax=Shewanella gaetbuli TaxID=220752 RepID=UPI003B5C06DC